MTMIEQSVPHEATRNACRLCSPLGASIAYLGIAGCVPLLHGGQGCATYIRRYCISHFREPVDIASSSFGEEATVFGGRNNLFTGLNNVISQYRPNLVGIASTCLAETIGEDVESYLGEYKRANKESPTELVFASTPSYTGSHYDGYHIAVHSTVKALAEECIAHDGINLMPTMVSPADLRHLKDICAGFGLKATMLPDYSDSLDGASWDEYHRIPEGGTPVEAIRKMAGAKASIEFARFIDRSISAASYLADTYGVASYRTGPPIGVGATDEFMVLLSRYAGRPIPERYTKIRGRLLDAYADAHKYVFGKKALVYGDPDFVIGIGRFLAEIGMIPIVCAAGKERNLAEKADDLLADVEGAEVYENVDFVDIERIAKESRPEVMIGSSKGYRISRHLGVPLIRLGFPIHDRTGGSRLRCLGYEGTQELFDRIVNSLLEYKQEESDVGYSYI